LVADAPLGVKVRSCRRLPGENAATTQEADQTGRSPAIAPQSVEPTRYRVEGRWISLSRVQREALGIEL
jgi:hypothetical protein